MKKIWIVVQSTPDPDYECGRIKCLSAHSSKKKAEVWLNDNEKMYKEDFSSFQIQSVPWAEEEP